MPFFSEHSLLRVDLPAFNAIDSTSVEDLFGMWSVISKASHALENGRRYENMSFRMMNRATFCRNNSKQYSATSLDFSSTSRPTAAELRTSMPALSSSLDSNSSDDSNSSVSETQSTRPISTRLDSSDSSRLLVREKPVAPVNLEKIVHTIQETSLEPIDLPTISAPQPTTTQLTVSRSPSRSTTIESSTSTFATKCSLNDSRSQYQVGSQESSATEMSTHSIVRGFHVGGRPSSYRSQTNLPAQPQPILKNNTQQQAQKKKGAMFTLGSSSGEDESSLESNMAKSAMSDQIRRSALGNSKKQTSFKEEVAVSHLAAQDSPVFDDSEDEEEEISESAIEDDDDSSDWEDSEDNSGPSSLSEHGMFQRVDSRPNLASRRSLLTTALHEPDRARAMAEAASRSAVNLRRMRPSNGPSLASSPNPKMPVPWPTQGLSAAQPISNSSAINIYSQLALSPRTTRRNMLSTELTESLRKNLLWERQHRSGNNIKAMQRRHTTHDMKNLVQHPEPGPVLSHRDPAVFSNDYFNAGLGEYHTKGW